MRSPAQARIKRSRAVELLATGCSYDEIAQQVGFTNRGSAHRAVSKALTERQAENIDLLRAMEGDRLDRLQSAMWDRAMTGDVRAVHAVSQVISQRIRLFGLDQYGPGHFDVTPQVLVVGPAEGNPGEATGDLSLDGGS